MFDTRIFMHPFTILFGWICVFFFSLADLEASRDQLLLELHKQKVKADPSDTKHENDAKVCR